MKNNQFYKNHSQSIHLLILFCAIFSISNIAFSSDIGNLSDSSDSLTNAKPNQFDNNQIEFNTDVMDVNDRSNIDITRFARAGYIMPGDYPLMVNINGSETKETTVTFLPPLDDPKNSIPCLTSEMVSLFAVKEDWADKLVWWKGNAGQQCLDFTSLPGMTAQADLSRGALKVTIPQAYVDFSSPDWDPPSRWDKGESGLLFDYYIDAQHKWQQRGNEVTDTSGNGTAGMNLGAWRFRADWQAQLNSNNQQNEKNFQWSRYYLYRAMPSLGAKFTFGETYLDSGLFDSFRFVGGTLNTDDNMLPPNLRGYAPEVTGVARTNAKVTVSQQGRVIYQTQVAPGPFRIQDLSEAISGQLDVKVEEQDGSSQTFQVNTASIPYLTRPGMIRWKLAGGRPTDWKHDVRGDTFSSGEFSWGVSNGWSLYSGLMASQHYGELAAGIGRDLMTLGALSFDATHSRAQLPRVGTLSGDSYRLSYSKRFEKINGQVTFAGYRFSQKQFMTMSEYLDARFSDVNHDGMTVGHSRELYTIIINKLFNDIGLSMYGNYSHQTYWDRPDSNRYSISMAKTLDIGDWRDISLSLTAYRTLNQFNSDDGAYLSVSVPWKNGGYLSYSGQTGGTGTTHSIGWSDSIDANNQYSLRAGTVGNSKGSMSGYYTHQGDWARTNINTSFQEGEYRSLGVSLQGGATATLEGAAFHRVSSPGSTRLMLDTNGISDVAVKGSGADLHTNYFGKAVVADINEFWRSSAGVDVNALDEDVDVGHPLTQFTLTEGAIGYRKLDVVSGRKMMADIRMPDGSAVAFGASVLRDGREVGIVGDSGAIWLTGIIPDVRMDVRAGGQTICHITLPHILPDNVAQTLLLPCS